MTTPINIDAITVYSSKLSKRNPARSKSTTSRPPLPKIAAAPPRGIAVWTLHPRLPCLLLKVVVVAVAVGDSNLPVLHLVDDGDCCFLFPWYIREKVVEKIFESAVTSKRPDAGWQGLCSIDSSKGYICITFDDNGWAKEERSDDNANDVGRSGVLESRSFVQGGKHVGGVDNGVDERMKGPFNGNIVSWYGLPMYCQFEAGISCWGVAYVLFCHWGQCWSPSWSRNRRHKKTHFTVIVFTGAPCWLDSYPIYQLEASRGS